MAPEIEPREDTLSGTPLHFRPRCRPLIMGKSPEELFSPRVLEETRWQPGFLGPPRGGLIGIFSSIFNIFIINIRFINVYGPWRDHEKP